jgi:serine protease inhibitor
MKCEQQVAPFCNHPLVKHLLMPVNPVQAHGSVALPAVTCQPTDQLPIKQLVTAINTIGDKLSEFFLIHPNMLTLVYSPISLAIALLLALNGVQGITEQELLNFLSLPSTITKQDLNATVNLIVQKLVESGHLLLANSLWSKSSNYFHPHFVQVSQQYYKATVRSANTVQEINQWVLERTHGEIKSILDDFSDLADLTLVNVVYFKAKWKKPFMPHATSSAVFNSIDIKTGNWRQIQESMMINSGSYYHTNTDQFEAIWLPYCSSRFELVVVLSKAPNGLSIPSWHDISQSIPINTTYGRIYLPKFRVECKLELVDLLSSLGITKLFELSGDFAPMVNVSVPAYINRIVQKVVLDVDETGTVAAAATVMSASFGCSRPPEDEFIMRCDRPFHVFLIDQPSQMVLFRGLYNGKSH